jgi:hypothetical protein
MKALEMEPLSTIVASAAAQTSEVGMVWCHVAIGCVELMATRTIDTIGSSPNRSIDRRQSYWM